MEIQSIVVNANSNATESVSKVKKCLTNLLPSFDPESLSIETVMGGYSNPITVMKYKSTNTKENHQNVESIVERLSEPYKEQLREELEHRLDPKGVLHLRFVKKHLFKGTVTLSTESDSVRIKLKITHQNHKLNIKKHINEFNEFLCELGIIER